MHHPSTDLKRARSLKPLPQPVASKIAWMLRQVIHVSCHLVFLWLATEQHAAAQDVDSRSNAIKQWSSGQWTFVTDLPVDDDVKAWPNVLDQALLQWCKKWNIPIDTAKQWPLTIHWIGDRKIFEQAGLLDGTPPFDDGFQLQDKIFFREQPSVYYRRHLLLHEATHWVMYRAFGGAGSPWFMEGMAEVEGTHELKQGQLQLAIIPADPLAVPHWGRFKRLRASVEDGKTPSMKQILRFGNQREDRMDRYVWSWAACVFFRNHPRYSQSLLLAASPPLDYSDSLSKRLESSLQNQWDYVEADWSLFAQDFDFGYDPTRYIFDTQSLLGSQPAIQPGTKPILVDSSLCWQGRAGEEVKKGMPLRIRANGQFVIANNPANSKTNTPWRCTPEGITIRYHQHLPLGKLLACFIPNPQSTKPNESRSAIVFPVGQQTEFTPPTDGWLLFKINEPVADLVDNAGSLTVEITASTP
jgi:hypothetical protein